MEMSLDGNLRRTSPKVIRNAGLRKEGEKGKAQILSTDLNCNRRNYISMERDRERKIDSFLRSFASFFC